MAYRRDSAITAAALRGNFTRLPFYAPDGGAPVRVSLFSLLCPAFLRKNKKAAPRLLFKERRKDLPLLPNALTHRDNVLNQGGKQVS